LNKWKKALSAGMSAALLASLFTVIAASTALATTSVTSVGTFGRGTTSTGTATFTFTETAVNSFANAIDATALTVTIMPKAPVTGTVAFVGTPVVTAPGSLGASATVVDNVLTIKITGADNGTQEQISVSGLKIKASVDASLGAIVATLGGNQAAAVTAATATATGILQAAITGAGAQTVQVNVTSTCGFDDSTANTANFSDTSDARTVTDDFDAGPGGQGATGIVNVAFGANAATHAIGTTVIQSVPACPGATTTLSSPGTVGDVVIQETGVPTNIFPGEQNQGAQSTSIRELTLGYVPVGTLTFTLSATGVQFSSSPAVADNDAGMTLGSSFCNVSSDRSSCSVSVTHVSTGLATITLSGINLDVASTVPSGTVVNVVVTSSPAINVKITANTIANVGRIVVGTAAQPVIFINFNDQSTGMITLTESAAGFFQAGTGANNRITLCLTTGEAFTRAPFAVITAGDLKLLTGLVGGTSVLGTLNTVGGNNCAYWTVYSASTVISTIEIRGSDSAGVVLPTGALNGPRLSVPSNLSPGTTQMSVTSGDGGTILATLGLVSNATRAFKSDVIVAAVSQPVIPAGATGAAAGDITITETLNGQFKPGQVVCIQIQPRTASTGPQDTWFDAGGGGPTSKLPVITTNAASGLLVSSVAVGGTQDSGCAGGISDNRAVASFSVTQQSFGGTMGVITISNLHYATNADAPDGNVLVRVFTKSVPAGVFFSTFISNARIGSTVAGTAATRLGVTQVGAFTTSTKVAGLHKYVTYRFDFGVGAAGAHVDIWGATKNGNDWTAFTKITTRVANASGVVYYYIRQGAATWKSYRAMWAGGGVWTPSRQARWR
jgi:hypothetical protein